ncbi:discoidin/SUN/FTP domain-containing protein [Anaeromicropila populeti]|uniref:F5/8 type C domain-containing protein n=1 Tax=Anaeromicropila populeti TaxID=37658 RepID=A0A1I6HVJ6_9FIRM|nr:hypothetical protein [Anaeromicropila populeti]SFR58459.1 hypothetical protein SAMN05661086_00334 [Anaeromicropila populeti]
MRNMKKIIICLVLVFSAVLFTSNLKSSADEITYSANVIPAMTSDTSPSGVASASSVYTYSSGATLAAWKAFDQVNTTSWAAAYGTTTGWLAYEFPDDKCICKYTITSRNPVASIKELPKNWTFEAWDEEATQWVVLDTQTNISNWELSVTKEFTFSNNKYYKKYRLNITANCGFSEALIIGEVEMMEIDSITSTPTPTPSATPVTSFQGNTADIRITMVTGEIKEYTLTIDKVDAFLAWYDSRYAGSGTNYFVFSKDATSYLSRSEYLVFDKISSFEIMDYNK